MDIFVVNTSDEIVGVLSDHNLLESVETESLNNLNILELSIDGNDEVASLLSEEAYLIFKTIDGLWKSYTIKEIIDDRGYYYTKSVYAEDTSHELLEILSFTDYNGVELAPNLLLAEILSGTRWTAGDIDTVSQNISIKQSTLNKSKLETIHILRAQYKLNFFSRIEVTGDRISGRYIDLKSRRNQRGKRFEFGKDLENLRREVDFTNLKTAILLKGVVDGDAERINMGSVVWDSGTGAPLDKPSGQLYLEDPVATANYGIYGAGGVKLPRMIYIEDDDLLTPQEVIQSAYGRLQNYVTPNVRYDIRAVDLFAITKDSDYVAESTHSGDMVFVVDRGMNPVLEVEAQIIEKVTDMLHPDKTTIKIGNPRNTFTSALTETVEYVDNKISANNDYLVNVAVDDMLNSAIDVINGNTGGYYRLLLNEFGKPYATVWSDKEDIYAADARYMMANSAGMSFGTQGLNNAPTLAIGIDGLIAGQGAFFESIQTGIITGEWGQSISALGDSVTVTIPNLISELESETNAQFATINTYFDFADDGLIITKSGSPFSIRLANDRMEFRKWNAATSTHDVMAYIDGTTMNITSLAIGDSIIVGKHIIEQYQDTGITIIKAI